MGAAGSLGTSRSAPGRQGDEQSPLGDEGALYADSGGEGLKGKEPAHFKTLVYRDRRPSDLALIGIVLDPVISFSFKKFMIENFKEPLLNFWLECNSYAQIASAAIKTKQLAAAHVYEIYLSPKAPYKNDFDLDEPTREQIVKDLAVAEVEGVYVVKTSKEDRLKNVFRLAQGKIFQILKFEYLQDFLVSEEFDELCQEMTTRVKVSKAEAKRNARKEKQAAQATDDDAVIDVEIIIRNPLGEYFFSQFIREHGLFQGKGQFLFELITEIEHYQTSNDPWIRQRRLKKIIDRYKNFDVISLEMMHLRSKVKNGKVVESKLEEGDDPMNILATLKEEIMDMLESQASTFKMTRQYKKYKDESVVDKSEATVRKLMKFAEENGLNEKRNKLTLVHLLNHNIGLSYFKKYCIKNYMEESIEFWIEVQAFKKTLRELEDPSTLSEETKTRATPLMTKYIAENGPSQVNISAAQRQATYDLFEAEKVDPNLFDVAEKEIYDLLKKNLFNDFMKTEDYKYLQNKIMEVKGVVHPKLKTAKSQAALG